MTITTITEKAIAVTGLPEGAHPINVGYNTEGVFLWYKYGHRNYQLRLNVYAPYRKEIKWRILGFAQDLTEAQKAEYEPLLKAKGLHVTNPFKDGKPSALNNDVWYTLEQWQSAELLTNPLILIR